MPYLAHRRLTWSGFFGTFAAPYEQWSIRLNLGVSESPGTPDLATVTAARDAFVTHLLPKISPFARLTECKGASIGSDGLYTGEPTILGVNLAGTGSALALPPQVAMAVSLNTGTRGARGRGRFFLPAPAVQFDAGEGLVVAASAQSVATSAAAFISAINGPAGFGNVIVASSFGINSVVTDVRVGRVLDTIRSRRRSIPEGYGADVAVTQ